MTFVLVTLLPTGRSRVIKKFSSRSQSKTSWPPLLYDIDFTYDCAFTVLKSYSHKTSYYNFLSSIMKLSFPVSTFDAHMYFFAISEKRCMKICKKTLRTTQKLFNN